MAKKNISSKENIPVQFREAYDRIMDKAWIAQQRSSAESTVFFDPETIRFIEPFLSKQKDLRWELQGGWAEAEYRIICFNPAFSTEEESPLCVLNLRPTGKTHQWAHRDVLGALMGTGMQRSRLGDILIHPWGAQVICLREAARILQTQLDSVARDKITVSIGDITAVEEPKTHCETCTVFVSGLRVDAVVAAAWNLSRSEAQELVRRDKIKVNYAVVSSSAVFLSEGDRISVRGFGRVTLVEVQGTTRKDRLRLLISKSAT